jgi:hypothetical protein
MRYVYAAVALVALGLAAAVGVPRLATLLNRDARTDDGTRSGYVRSTGGALTTAHLSVRLSSSADALAPGGQATLIADVTPKRNMHVYAPGQDGYIPISLALNHSNAFRTGPPAFPDAEPYFFAPLKQTVQVFGKPFRITSVLTIGRSPEVERRAAAGDSVRVAGRLTYQACDDAVCYRSETIPVGWMIRLKK